VENGPPAFIAFAINVGLRPTTIAPINNPVSALKLWKRERSSSSEHPRAESSSEKNIGYTKVDAEAKQQTYEPDDYQTASTALRKQTGRQ
jgi:hypothetical protein